MYYLVLITLLSVVGEVSSMGNRKSLDLTPGAPNGDFISPRSSSPTRSCALCALDAQKYRQEIKNRTTSGTTNQQEYVLACLFHRLGNNEFDARDTEKLTVLQWILFQNVSKAKYNGDTEKTLETLHETFHCPKVEDQVEAHRKECVDRATQLLLEAQKLQTIKSH